MNSNTNTKANVLKRKCTKGPALPPTREKHSGLNPDLTFVERSKDPNPNEETVSIKMRINDSISKGETMN